MPFRSLRGATVSAALAGALWFASASSAAANLLRNPRFQDDWITLLPENQNHHWCYATGFQNRRDYIPDGWHLAGSWVWVDEDEPRGSRRLVLRGPKVEIRQRIPWVLVHDDRKRDGFPDAGGFPAPALQRSRNPLALVRDLTLRVKVRGTDVVPGAGVIELGLSPPGKIAADDAMGTVVPFTTSVTLSVPPGTFASQWIEVRLPAQKWLDAARTAASAGADEREGAALPGTCLLYTSDAADE